MILDDFDVLALQVDASTIIGLTPDLRIGWVNAAWARFAIDNGVADLPSQGRAYLDAIPEVLRAFYARAFAEAVERGVPWHHDYECSSDRVERQFRLTAYPLRGRGLLLVHALLVEVAHTREACAGEELRYRSSAGLVVQCAHCRRIQRAADPATWDWVPSWVARAPGRVSHGLCPACMGHYFPPEPADHPQRP